MAQRVRALVFDAYGTLFDVHSVGSACDELFPGRGRALSQLWRAKQLEYTWLMSLMGRYEDFWHVSERALEYAVEDLELSCGPSDRARLMDEYLHLATHRDVRSAIQALSGVPMAILSNGSPDMLRAAVEHSGLSSAFAHIISVDELRVYKPSPKVYQLAVDKLGVDAAELGFVSANSWDAIGARAFGFWTCWVNRSGSSLDHLGVAPDITVSSLTELAAELTAPG